MALATSRAASAQDDEAPKPVVDLKPGTANYDAHFEINGRLVPLEYTRTIKAQGGAWLVVETVKMASYTAIDSALVARKTLIPRRRVFRDPTAAVDLQFVGRRVSGTIVSKGQTVPIDADMGGVPFADGPAGPDAVAALPLAQGYTTEFRTFDANTRQVSPVQLRVLGSDTVTVPAGTFSTWKVLTVAADGGAGETAAMWIDKKSRRVVKMATTLLGRNEMVATLELTR
jgi:hypothetical protein